MIHPQAIPLNDYQQLMLRITELSPYNAVHAVPFNLNHIPIETLASAISELIASLSIGIPVFSPTLLSVQFTPHTFPIHVAVAPTTLADHMKQEMNTAFANDCLPLRFHIITYDQETYFTITYNHWIADAYSIIKLMEAIFHTVHHAELRKPLYLNVSPMPECFPILRRKNPYWSGIKQLWHYARAYRTPLNDMTSTETGCEVDFLLPADLAKLRTFCKTQQVTLNDFFIALLAKLLGEQSADQRHHAAKKRWIGKRNRIVISVIVNIRGHSLIPLQQHFGLFLSYFLLSFRTPEQECLKKLCHQITKKTRRLKRMQTALKQFPGLSLLTQLWDRATKTHSKYRLFSKNTPMTAGISNVVLDGIIDSTASPLHAYARCSPTAMVFNITTCANQMFLAISYRQTCYSQTDIQRLKTKCFEAIRDLP